MNQEYLASRLPPFSLLDEPELSFDPEGTQRDVNPLRGLSHHGPYSAGTFSIYRPEIRLATIAPKSGWSGLRDLVNTLRSTHTPRDRTEYVPDFGGFERTFGVPIVASPTAAAHIKLADDVNAIGQSGAPSERLAQALGDAINRLSLIQDQFDVVLVHLPEAWRAASRAPDFDAHDALKAMGAAKGISTQVINDRAVTFGYKASLGWRLSIALYVKAGGVPWKLAPIPGSPEDTAFIGLAYALRGDPSEAHYVTCCSQVFDADGGGMQFVAYEARDPVKDVQEAKRNPFLTRDDMRAVLARSLNLYQGRNGGRPPRRMVVHKTTAFKPEELDGALDALSCVEEVECVEISSTPGWRGVWLKESTKRGQRSQPDGYPVPRGTCLHRSGTSALVWVAGNAPRAALRGDYYQGKKSIPRPISLTRHAGQGALETTAIEALALTKMDWNNDALYDPVPVTIRYSQTLAQTIANVPSLPGREYPYRLFM